MWEKRISFIHTLEYLQIFLDKEWQFLSRPKPDTWICDHDRHANIKPKPNINKNQLNF